MSDQLVGTMPWRALLSKECAKAVEIAEEVARLVETTKEPAATVLREAARNVGAHSWSVERIRNGLELAVETLAEHGGKIGDTIDMIKTTLTATETSLVPLAETGLVSTIRRVVPALIRSPAVRLVGTVTIVVVGLWVWSWLSWTMGANSADAPVKPGISMTEWIPPGGGQGSQAQGGARPTAAIPVRGNEGIWRRKSSRSFGGGRDATKTWNASGNSLHLEGKSWGAVFTTSISGGDAVRPGEKIVVSLEGTLHATSKAEGACAQSQILGRGLSGGRPQHLFLTPQNPSGRVTMEFTMPRGGRGAAHPKIVARLWNVEAYTEWEYVWEEY